jgi:hypothetical protein
MTPAIIIVTYNRPHSLKRVLSSVNNGVYKNDNIPLVISIDYQDSENHNEVIKIANNFEWKYGDKRIIEHKENLGLRNHVISCGNLSEEYGSIIMLEDDVYVSPQFYDYSVQMLEYYHDKDYIAGISLYKHSRNVNVNRPFYPENNGYDVYFLQRAMSWGQCWTYKMWNDFYEWYLENQTLLPENDIPRFVSGWPNSSWLKYFIKYVIKRNKYFVYPYESLSTNFGDLGTHNTKEQNNNSQVSLLLNNKTYDMPNFNNTIKYDAFFERIGLEKTLNLQNVSFDLYGTKENNNKQRYLFTMEILPYKIMKSYGLNFRPHELNVILDNPGEDIFLYDTEVIGEKQQKKENQLIFLYDNPTIEGKKAVKYLLYKLLEKMKF